MPQVIYMPENKNTVGAQMAQMLPMLQQLALAKIQKKWTAEERELELEAKKVALEEQRDWEKKQADIKFERDLTLKKTPTTSISVRDTDPNAQMNDAIDNEMEAYKAKRSSFAKILAAPETISKGLAQIDKEHNAKMALIKSGIYDSERYSSGEDVYNALQSGKIDIDKAKALYRHKGFAPYIPPKAKAEDEPKPQEGTKQQAGKNRTEQPVDTIVPAPATETTKPKPTAQVSPENVPGMTPGYKTVMDVAGRVARSPFADRIQRNRQKYAIDQAEEERKKRQVAQELALRQQLGLLQGVPGVSGVFGG